MTQASTAQADPRTLFPGFYLNPAVRDVLGPRRMWTVSDPGKKPISIVEAMAGVRNPDGTLPGARLEKAEQQLLTLDELTERLPDAANAATHFDHGSTGLMILDIEPSCPPELADRLLHMAFGPDPVALYSEVSMSGRGFHLIMPTPRSVARHPAATGRIQLKHPQKWFEVLLHHWVTFTRSPVPSDRVSAAASAEPVDWSDLFSALAQVPTAARPDGPVSAPGSLDREALFEEPESAMLREIEAQVRSSVLADFLRSWDRGPCDYHFDMSKWEYAQIAWLAQQARTALQTQLRMLAGFGPEAADLPSTVSIEHLSRVVHRMACEVIPHRPKHDQRRSGVPYLLYRTITCVESMR